MAGKSSKTEVITLRVALAPAAQWRFAAEAGGVTIGAFIIGRVEAVPLLHRQIEELNESGDAVRAALATANAEVASLKRELAKRPSLLPASLPKLTDYPKRDTSKAAKKAGKGKR